MQTHAGGALWPWTCGESNWTDFPANIRCRRSAYRNTLLLLQRAATFWSTIARCSLSGSSTSRTSCGGGQPVGAATRRYISHTHPFFGLYVTDAAPASLKQAVPGFAGRGSRIAVRLEAGGVRGRAVALRGVVGAATIHPDPPEELAAPLTIPAVCHSLH